MMCPVPAHSPCQSTSGSRLSKNSQAFHFSVPPPPPPEDSGLWLPPLLLCKSAPVLDCSFTHICKLISDLKPRPRPHPFPSFSLFGFLDRSLLLLLTPSPSLSIPPSGSWLVKRGGAWLRATSMHTQTSVQLGTAGKRCSTARIPSLSCALYILYNVSSPFCINWRVNVMKTCVCAAKA